MTAGPEPVSDCNCSPPQRHWPDVLTAREAAAFLRLDYLLVLRLARAGALPALRAGRTWRFRRDLLLQALERRAGDEQPT